jgi:predicted nucleotidyltransferase
MFWMFSHARTRDCSMPPDSTRDLVSLKDLGIADRVPVQPEQLDAFCRKHNIREMALFGSVLRDDFTSASDIDLLVSFSPTADHSLLDHVNMEHELAALLGRKVDLVEKEAVENPFVRQQIHSNLALIYAA